MLGFRERTTSFIADVKRCEVLKPPVDSLIEPLSLLLTALSVRNRVPQIEVAVADNAVALVVRVLEELTAADRELLLQFAREHGVQLYLQPGGYETVAPLTEVTPLEYRLPQFDVTVRFQPNDFVQVNGELNARMVARAVELLAPAAGERVLDLFCGLGNFSLPLARNGAQVVGVEGDAGLVARARANAALNGIDTIEFVCGDLAQPAAGDAVWARRAIRQGAARSAAGRRTRGAADRCALRRQRGAVHFLPPRQPGARCGHPRTRARLYAARRGRHGHVPAYCPCRISGTVHAR